MATAKKAAAKKAASTTTSNTGNGEKKVSKAFYYIVYVDAYRNDTVIVPRGIYRTKTKIDRFERLSNKFVESFEGKIPDPKIFKLAEELKITVTDESGDYLDSKVLLEELVQDLD